MNFQYLSILSIIYAILLATMIWHGASNAQKHNFITDPSNQNDTYLKVEKMMDTMWPVITSARG